MRIEFDPDKDAANVAVHGISLDQAETLLLGFTVQWADQRRDYGEIRVIAIGEIGDREFCCVYARRGEAFRPISLRRASRKERNVYQEAKAARAAGEA
jgi:uncharacterized DUF497 family protein